MTTVLNCIAYQHNIWLVIVAVLICGAGSWVTARLFQRTTRTTGLQQAGWYFLTALAAGVAIWCTHFVAMLGFEAGVPVSFDPLLTFVSLMIAVIGSTIGFAIAGSRTWAAAPALGGAVVGLAIAAMHYVGMMAYRVQGIVTWDRPYLIASIVLSVVFSALALHVAMRAHRNACNLMAGVLAFAVVALHFTGMAAFHVQPLLIDGSFSDPQALEALALAIAGMAAVIVAAGLASYLIDDSARAESIERLRRMAMMDTLTNLPNRASFNERLDHELALAQGRESKLALIGIDLNRFKEINDLRGHHAGDEVLRVLGRRLQALLNSDDGEFVARIGGDEFAAICRTGDVERITEFVGRLETAMFKPVRVDDFEVTPGASFGVAIYPDHAEEKAFLINNADLAMYRAKSDLMQTTCFYEAGMDDVIRARRCLAADLRKALERGELSVHFQVQASISTGEVLGYEALLRWHHPRHGLILPSEFVPIAEESGLILEIGEWVLASACIAATKWPTAYKVSVNLSAIQFAHSDLSGLVSRVLATTGLAPERLELELTESTIFADKDRALLVLRRIRELGVSVALDDFGTGFSSLGTLHSFPFDRIKIDRSFIADIASNPQSVATVRAVLALAKTLKISVVAEGIETADQLAILSAEGCDEAQGYLLGHPEPLHPPLGLQQARPRRIPTPASAPHPGDTSSPSQSRA